IWSGRVQVVSCGERCKIPLEDPNSRELFAACFMNPGHCEAAVESVLDSSRRVYVYKYVWLTVIECDGSFGEMGRYIEDGSRKHAFIGLGFAERNEAFDFNVALSDREKKVRRENEKVGGDSGGDSQDHIDIHHIVNHRLK
ncbi:DUF1681 domain-containing protein, partial [Cephalotus follicularis]